MMNRVHCNAVKRRKPSRWRTYSRRFLFVEV
jgi:hypothetical protein